MRFTTCLAPTKEWVKELIDEIIADEFASADLELAWLDEDTDGLRGSFDKLPHSISAERTGKSQRQMHESASAVPLKRGAADAARPPRNCERDPNADGAGRGRAGEATARDRCDPP